MIVCFVRSSSAYRCLIHTRKPTYYDLECKGSPHLKINSQSLRHSNQAQCTLCIKQLRPNTLRVRTFQALYTWFWTSRPPCPTKCRPFFIVTIYKLSPQFSCDWNVLQSFLLLKCIGCIGLGTYICIYTARPSAHGMSDPFLDQGDYMGNFRWKIFGGKVSVGKDIMSLAQKKENRESTHHHTHENFGWSLPLEAEHQYVLDHHLCYWKSDWVMTRPKMVFWEGRELLLTSTMLRPKWRSRVIWAIAERGGCRIEDN